MATVLEGYLQDKQTLQQRVLQGGNYGGYALAVW